MYTHVHCVQACAYEHGCLRRQASSDLLELEIRQYKLLEAGARSHSENQTPVLRKNNVCSSPLSILPSPGRNSFAGDALMMTKTDYFLPIHLTLSTLVPKARLREWLLCMDARNEP